MLNIFHLTGFTPLRACSGFVFGASEAKFGAERGVMREHSQSYVTEEQQSAAPNFASTAQR